MIAIFHSLQVRLTIGFASILLIAISLVSGYSAYVTRSEIVVLRNEIETVKNIRAEELITKTYEATNDWDDVQYAAQQVGTLFGWHVIIENSKGKIVADSHNQRIGDDLKSNMFKPIYKRPIIINGKNAGWMLINDKPRHNAIIPQPVSQKIISNSKNIQNTNLEGELNNNSQRIISEVLEVVEPPLTDLQSTFQNALIIAGTTSVLAGLFIVSIFTRQSLKPVKYLTKAAKKIGSGDLNYRVKVESDDEIGQLSKTFNNMANELESLQKERRQMTANIAHELRTPLTNIRGYLEGIQDKVLKPNDENIDTLFNQTLHLNNLVDDLRVLSMIESGNLNLNLVEGDIVKIIEISTKDFYPRAKNSGVKINLELQNITEEKKIYFDDTRMRQIIANLIENAFSYNSENNEITIRSKISDNYYVIKIIDQGEGIPEKEVNKIFNEFYRVDKSRSKKTGGVGLGLSIVKSLIEAHNGEISVNSKINSGTTFTIKLPIIS